MLILKKVPTVLEVTKVDKIKEQKHSQMDSRSSLWLLTQGFVLRLILSCMNSGDDQTHRFKGHRGTKDSKNSNNSNYKFTFCSGNLLLTSDDVLRHQSLAHSKHKFYSSAASEMLRTAHKQLKGNSGIFKPYFWHEIRSSTH